MTHEDAVRALVQWLREPRTGGYSNYGYDLYLPTMIRAMVQREDRNAGSHAEERKLKELTPVFCDAAWELARRGVIRPGVKNYRMQSVDDGAGFGFSMTPFGRQWLNEAEHETFVPTEPGRFAEMLAPFSARFGDGFHERAQEAIRCYGAHAYLACCAMAGAAAEAVLLALAIEKSGDEDRVLKTYKSASGRGRIQNEIVGKAEKHLQREFNACVPLLKYWRDAAAHGHASGIREAEAFSSLAMLLRFANFADDNWEGLTRPDPKE